MTGLSRCRYTNIRRPVAAALVVVLILFGAAGRAAARGPDGIADIANNVMDAVVNISTSQKVEVRGDMPQLPPGSPFEEFFEEFFKNRRGQDKLRIGEWVIAIGNPFSLGGTVTAGIVSARNRDINSGPYDNYIQTDAAINRGNSGGPLFNLDGEVVGVNTAIISPSGGSIGIGFAVPSKTAMPVIDQLRQFGETRRGWLGVRIQHMTDELAETMNVKPPRGALVAGVDDKGPAKPAGIRTGDVIVRFDNKDIKEMRDLPRVVADTPVGKDVEVVILRQGKEERKTVKLGRLEDGEKQAALASKRNGGAPEEKSVVQQTLGLNLANLTIDLRRRYKIKDSVNGVVITGVDANSAAAEKRLNAGDVIVEVAQEAVGSAADVQKRIDQLKKDGRKSALLLVANAEGDLRFVALTLQ